jgi:hypothetical protein
MFLAHDVLFEISLTNSEALSIQVIALNSTWQPLSLTGHDSSKPEILKIMLPVVGVKIDGDFFPHQSNTKAWDDGNVGYVSCNLFLTRMSHHLVEPFDSMNYL